MLAELLTQELPQLVVYICHLFTTIYCENLVGVRIKVLMRLCAAQLSLNLKLYSIVIKQTMMMMLMMMMMSMLIIVAVVCIVLSVYLNDKLYNLFAVTIRK